ncbi:hypothetical protein ACFL5G_00365 [Candidatus Margulisiibacteriota bacterium]
MFNKIISAKPFCIPHFSEKLVPGVHYKIAICLPRHTVINLGPDARLENEDDEQFFKDLLPTCEKKCKGLFPRGKNKKLERLKQFVLIGIFRIRKNPKDKHVDLGAALEPPLYKDKLGQYNYYMFRNAVIQSACALASFLKENHVPLHGVSFFLSGFHAGAQNGASTIAQEWIGEFSEALKGSRSLLDYIALRSRVRHGKIK